MKLALWSGAQGSDRRADRTDASLAWLRGFENRKGTFVRHCSRLDNPIA
jgi:hypothetical protein